MIGGRGERRILVFYFLKEFLSRDYKKLKKNYQDKNIKNYEYSFND